MKRSIGRGTRAWQGALVICDVYNRDVYFLMRGYRLRDYVPQEKGVLDEVCMEQVVLGSSGKTKRCNCNLQKYKTSVFIRSPAQKVLLRFT